MPSHLGDNDADDDDDDKDDDHDDDEKDDDHDFDDEFDDEDDDADDDDNDDDNDDDDDDADWYDDSDTKMMVIAMRMSDGRERCRLPPAVGGPATGVARGSARGRRTSVPKTRPGAGINGNPGRDFCTLFGLKMRDQFQCHLLA